jgi:hypothetical protein
MGNNDEPRPEGTGYRLSPEELHSGFNTFFKRPEGRGIKPLNTNKKDGVPGRFGTNPVHTVYLLWRISLPILIYRLMALQL